MSQDDLTTEGYSRKPLPTLRDMIAVLFRQRKVILVTFFLVVAAALLSGKWVPSYEAKMKILALRQRTDAIMTSSANLPAPFTGDQIREEDLNSEVELLNSDDLIRKVVKNTGLATDPDNAVSLARAVKKLGKDLQIEAARKSNVISVSYKNRDPQVAAKVLQELSAAYIQKHLDMSHSSEQFNFFDQQTQQYLRGLNDAQQKLTDFTNTTGVVSAQVERDDALAHANEFNANARQTQASIVEAQRRVESLESQLRAMHPRITTTVRTADNPQLLQQLKSTLLNLELKRTELLTKYAPTYRLVQEVDQQIADAKTSIAAETSKPLRDESTGENPNYQWVEQELTKARADLNGLRARAATAASIAQRYHDTAKQLDLDTLRQHELQQDVKTQEENFLLYEHKREEARINDALDRRGIVNVAMAERPVVPAIPSQSLVNFAVAVLLIASVISVGMGFAIDLLNPTFRTPDELGNYLGVPVLATLRRVEG